MDIFYCSLSPARDAIPISLAEYHGYRLSDFSGQNLSIGAYATLAAMLGVDMASQTPSAPPRLLGLLHEAADVTSYWHSLGKADMPQQGNSSCYHLPVAQLDWVCAANNQRGTLYALPNAWPQSLARLLTADAAVIIIDAANMPAQLLRDLVQQCRAAAPAVPLALRLGDKPLSAPQIAAIRALAPFALLELGAAALAQLAGDNKDYDRQLKHALPLADGVLLTNSPHGPIWRDARQQKPLRFGMPQF